MDFWTRLFGVSYAPRKPAVKPVVTPKDRLTRLQAALADVDRLCSNKRDLARERSTLAELQKLFERLAQIIREETRASIPHPCVAWALKHQVFVTVNRAAAVSFHEGCIHAAISLMAALVDSEEESFLTNTSFAKSLMRLVTRVINAGDVLLSVNTETFILELLFTISAKIRLQPEILPSWFSVTRRSQSEEKSTHTKDDFPLCYILVDRIYHDGRIGDFARTGLLYIFEATGKSSNLEQWIVESSDVCTLMASGLGALYSQLSRELSILYPDAVLPAALALSDYTTTYAQATAESAFSERHIAHMTTFLSYLAFWQDILDHCKSDEVRQNLLDHFQLLFLQQLLYPSILESSDLDRGSSVAVLSYLTAILESLDHPVLIDSIMSYLLAVDLPNGASDLQFYQEQHSTPKDGPKRRQSLLELKVADRVDHTFQPALFNLADLLQNSLASSNTQTLFCALRLTSTIVSRQSHYAFTSMIKADLASGMQPKRGLGSVHIEIEQYTLLARRIHNQGLQAAFIRLMDDLQSTIEDRASTLLGYDGEAEPAQDDLQRCLVVTDGTFLRRILCRLDDFFTNSIDVNLALTECIIAIACCSEIRLDGWLCLDGVSQTPRQAEARPIRQWQQHLDPDEESSFATVLRTTQPPDWPQDDPPLLYAILTRLIAALDNVRAMVPNLDTLITGRKNLLQAASIDVPIEIPPSTPSSPSTSRIPSGTGPSRNNSRSPAPRESTGERLSPDADTTSTPSHRSTAASPMPGAGDVTGDSNSALLDPKQLFRPPPQDIPSTTDILMQLIEFETPNGAEAKRTASLNHVLTNAIVLQEFILEIVAVLSIRASALGESEVRIQ